MTQKKNDCTIEKIVEPKQTVFTIIWSNLQVADKHEIRKSVPHYPGIFELYYKDERGGYVSFFIAKVWYGGLRDRIRECTDPELMKNPQRREILETKQCFFRYTISENKADLFDAFYTLAVSLGINAKEIPHTNRYPRMIAEEIPRRRRKNH